MSPFKRELYYCPPGTPGSPRSPVGRKKYSQWGIEDPVCHFGQSSCPHKKEFMSLACLQVLPSPARPHWAPCIYTMDWIIHITQNPQKHSVIKPGRAWLQEWLSYRWKKFPDSKWDLLSLLLWTLKLSLPEQKNPTIRTVSELQNTSASLSNFWSNNNPGPMTAIYLRKQVTPDLPLGPCIPMSPEKRGKKNQERSWRYFQ